MFKKNCRCCGPVIVVIGGQGGDALTKEEFRETMATFNEKLTELETSIEDLKGKEAIEDAEEQALRDEIAALKAAQEAGTLTEAQEARLNAAIEALKAGGFGDVTEPAPVPEPAPEG